MNRFLAGDVGSKDPTPTQARTVKRKMLLSAPSSNWENPCDDQDVGLGCGWGEKGQESRDSNTKDEK